MKSLVKKLGLAVLVTLSSAGVVGGVSNAFQDVKNIGEIRAQSAEEKRKSLFYLGMGMFSVVPLGVGLGIYAGDLADKYFKDKGNRNNYQI
ncbi:hypothetical protein CEE44_05375 [Candidatus Woesearchaeota archaeon B3_Woes]|nr:MAG: hypothetical protein CEE44_05375 [Candidatus Woesearchaeota archaeon B3_Woes]